MTNDDQVKIEGVGRIPKLSPEEVVKAAQKQFPNIPNWYAQFAQVATTLLDVSDHDLVGHAKPQDCQLKVLGHGDGCGRGADFILVHLTFEGQDTPTAINSRVRYYCAPCVYASMNRALQSITDASKLGDGGAWEGLDEWSQQVLDQRIMFVEKSIVRTATVVEEKYPDDGEDLIKALNQKFTG